MVFLVAHILHFDWSKYLIKSWSVQGMCIKYITEWVIQCLVIKHMTWLLQYRTVAEKCSVLHCLIFYMCSFLAVAQRFSALVQLLGVLVEFIAKKKECNKLSCARFLIWRTNIVHAFMWQPVFWTCITYCTCIQWMVVWAFRVHHLLKLGVRCAAALGLPNVLFQQRSKCSM